ncbi:nuclear transport factor 2 family protein [Streptomyces sp. JNUCC 63]
MASRDAIVVKGTLGLLAEEGMKGDLADMGPAEQADPFQEDIAVHEAESLPYGGDWKGREGLRNLMDTIGSITELAPTDIEVFDAGDGIVITRQTANFTSKSTGATLSVPMVEIYTMVDGKIQDIDVYYKDTKAMVDLFSAASD